MSRFPHLPNTDKIRLIDVLKSYFDEMSLRGISTLLLSAEAFAGLNSQQYNNLITLLSKGKKINLEVIYFEFDPVKRLKSYENEFIRSGEFVDSNARQQILNYISQLKGNLENFFNESTLIVHRINYDSLGHHTEIYKKSLDLILNLNENLFQGEWLLPPKGINASIPEKQLNLLNEFNRLNTGERRFDRACPVQYSNLFPEQTVRLIRFRQSLYESIERDRALAERDILLNSKSWRFLQSYRYLRDLFSKK